MSKQVYSIDNMEKFNVAMVVGSVTGAHKNNYKETENWCYDTEMADLSLEIYNSVKGKSCSNAEIAEVVKSWFNNPLHDVSSLPNAEDDEDYQDFWYGVEFGDFLGYPSVETYKIANKVMKIFMDQMKYGFVHEVLVNEMGLK